MAASQRAAQAHFLPCRSAEGPAKLDALLLAARLPRSEPAQRYCAAASFLYAQTASDLFLRCRQAVPGCAEWQTAMQDCLALHLARLHSVRLAVCQASAQRCFAAVQIRSVSSAPVRCCCDTTFLRDRSADWYCAADFDLLFFLPRRTKQLRCGSVPMRGCADGTPTGTLRFVPSAYSAKQRRP